MILLLLPLIIGCTNKSSPITKIDLSSVDHQVSPKDHSQEPPLKVAIASITSTKESIKYYDELLNYLGEKLKRRVLIIQRRTYAEVNDLIRAGNVDLAFVCTYAYITGKEEVVMELLAAPKMTGGVAYQSYIIVQKDSEAKSLQDLKGKTFAFTDPLSTTGRIYPLYLLRTFNETPDTFFKRYIYTYSHDNAIKAVADQLVDGAAIDSLVYHYIAGTNADYIAKTKVISQSPAYGVPPIVVRPDLDPHLKEQIRLYFIELNLDSKGQEILSKLLIEKYVIPKDEEYNSVRSLAKLVF
jgi:phosphonate transport system substrate-binding protein